VMDPGDIVSDIESGAGCWVRNGESEKLAEQIRRLRHDPEKAAQMQRICRELYLEKYTAPICTAKYVEMFRTLG